MNDKLFLNKVAEFITIGNEERRDFLTKVSALQEKEAEYLEKISEYETSIAKLANVLLQEDFLSGDLDVDRFVKKAKEDKSFLASTIKKVCESAGVSVMGKTARVAVKSTFDKEGEDPIMRRAFGWNSSNGFDSLVDL